MAGAFCMMGWRRTRRALMPMLAAVVVLVGLGAMSACNTGSRRRWRIDPDDFDGDGDRHGGQHSADHNDFPYGELASTPCTPANP